MTDERPYRAAISETEARKYLIEWAGIEFDPKVVKAFLTLEIIKETGTAEKEPETPLIESTEIIDSPENPSQPLSIYTNS
jgi:HD-GYP domain-containing protein (c-di-GMP phosphodiesterase class II)